ncbi:Uma2 family endonuclease [Actinoplanes sp. NPDC051343]|uniref:Uma2 family endonuclease n=1 Tax=Actinoplanes sp. NPDC051343 TaxID=3363906 RepID=UPI0037B7DDCE
MTAVMLPVDPHLLERDDLTVDDLVDLPDDLRYELIEGRLILTPVGLPIHQVLEMRVANAIEENCPDDFVVNVEQALLKNRRNEFRPDVLLLHEKGAGRSPVLPSDVPLVVEIVSESSRFTDRRQKLKWYAELGIPAYWIVDPLAMRITLTVFRLGSDGRYRPQLQTDELVTLEEPWKVTLDLPAWTRKRDRLRAAASADV